MLNVLLVDGVDSLRVKNLSILSCPCLIRMKVLVHFAQSHDVFRLPELLSICETENLEIEFNAAEYSLKVTIV